MNYRQAREVAHANGEEVIPTLCRMCGPGNGCGFYAFTKNGHFTKVAGMDESPVNRGSICAKGHAAPQLTERYPLILSDYHTSKSYSASWQRNVPHLRPMIR